MLVVQQESVAVPSSSQHLSGLGVEQQPALEDTAGSSGNSPQATQYYSKFAAADATPLPADIQDRGATSSGQSLLNFPGETAMGGEDCQLPPTMDGETAKGYDQVNTLCASSTSCLHFQMQWCSKHNASTTFCIVTGLNDLLLVEVLATFFV